MVSNDKGVIKLSGSGIEIVQEVLALVYATKKALKDNQILVDTLDVNLGQIILNEFDDNVALCKRFDSAEECRAFMNAISGKTRDMHSVAEDIMRDITGDNPNLI